eukprot:GHVS01018724.1.p1 GENE.GHVS01018724.1~~GHVS01018724.1.p1  ORF type:complete len:531 (-),score=43.71 GHVS01018724.1:116-1708(-)
MIRHLEQELNEATAATSVVKSQIADVQQRLQNNIKALQGEVAASALEAECLDVASNIWNAGYRRLSTDSDATVIAEIDSPETRQLSRLDAKLFSESLTSDVAGLLGVAVRNGRGRRGPGATRRLATTRQLTASITSVNPSRARFVGACLRRGEQEFKIYGQFGFGMEASTVEALKTKMGLNKVMVQCQFTAGEGVSSAILSDVVAAYPGILRDAMSRSTSLGNNPVPPLSLAQISGSKSTAVIYSHEESVAASSAMFAPVVNHDYNITFLVRVFSRDLESGSLRSASDLDKLFAESHTVLHSLIKAGASRLRGGDIKPNDFSVDRVVYNGLAIRNSSDNDCCGDPSTYGRTPNFGVGLEDEQLHRKIAELADGGVLVHFGIVGLGNDIKPGTTITAQEAFHYLGEELPRSRERPIGSSAMIVLAAKAFPPKSELALEGSSQVIPLWLILLCLLIPVMAFAIVFGIVWESKRLSCGCMPRYGVEADRMPKTTAEFANQWSTPNSSGSATLVNRTWVRLSKAIDHFVVHYLV